MVSEYSKIKELKHKNKKPNTGSPHSQTYSNDPDRKRDDPQKYQEE
jgi:hypothetical protein